MNALYLQTALLMAGAYFLGTMLACLLRKLFASDRPALDARAPATAAVATAATATTTASMAQTTTVSHDTTQADTADVSITQVESIDSTMESATEALIEPAPQRVPLTTAEISKPGRSLAGEIASNERVDRFERSLAGDQTRAVETASVETTVDTTQAQSGISATTVAASVAAAAVAAVAVGTRETETFETTNEVASPEVAHELPLGEHELPLGERELPSTEIVTSEEVVDTTAHMEPTAHIDHEYVDGEGGVEITRADSAGLFPTTPAEQNIEVPVAVEAGVSFDEAGVEIETPVADLVPDSDLVDVEHIDVEASGIEASNVEGSGIEPDDTAGISAAVVGATAIAGIAGAAVFGATGADDAASDLTVDDMIVGDGGHDETIEEAVATRSVEARNVLESVAPVAATVAAVAGSTVAADTARDDLQNIDNIDAGIEDQLNRLGVIRYSQIAGWSSGDVAGVQNKLGMDGRVQRENWIEQAQILAGGGQTIYSRSRGFGAGHVQVSAAEQPVAVSTDAMPNMVTTAVEVDSSSLETSEAVETGGSVENWAAQQTADLSQSTSASSSVPQVSDVISTEATPSTDATPMSSHFGATSVAAGIAAAATAAAATAATVVSETDIDGVVVEENAAIEAENVVAEVEIASESGQLDTGSVSAATSGIAAAAAAAAIAVSQRDGRAGAQSGIEAADGAIEVADVSSSAETGTSSVGAGTVTAISGIAAAAAAAMAGAQRDDSTEVQSGVEAVDGAVEATVVSSSAETGTSPVGAGTVTAISGIAAAAAAAMAGTQRNGIVGSVAETITGDDGRTNDRSSFGGMRSVKSEAYNSGSSNSAPVGARVVSGHVDDLKRVRGIGVLIERRLNSLGVTQYAQMANWSSSDVEKVSQAFDFKGRIERENWIEQARILASGGYTEFSSRVDRGEVDTSKNRG